MKVVFGSMKSDFKVGFNLIRFLCVCMCVYMYYTRSQHTWCVYNLYIIDLNKRIVNDFVL